MTVDDVGDASSSRSAKGRPVRKRRRRFIVAALVLLMLGGLTAAGAAYTLNREADQEYQVSVYLRPDVTGEQRRAVESALAGLRPDGGVRFESREQAWANLQRLNADNPDGMAGVRPESLPESFLVTLARRKLNCAELDPVRRMPGVSEVLVLRTPTKKEIEALKQRRLSSAETRKALHELRSTCG